MKIINLYAFLLLNLIMSSLSQSCLVGIFDIKNPDSKIYQELSKRIYRVTDRDQEIAKELTFFPNFRNLVSRRYNQVIKPGEDLDMLKEEVKIIDRSNGKDITADCENLEKINSYSNDDERLILLERDCEGAIYFKPFKMADMLEFTAETSNFVLKENVDKRTVSV